MLNTNTAVILAAGLGQRLNRLSGELPKPLMPLCGAPLIEHVMLGARQAGIERFVIVVGHKAGMVRRWLGASPLHGTSVTFVENSEYRKSNGVSLLAAKDVVERPFLLLMTDHIFDPIAAGALIRQPLGEKEVILAVDRKLDCIFDMDDATKVLSMGDYILQIGKNIARYDAIDTGMFLCSPAIFDSLEAAMTQGNCSLSDGMQRMASQRKLRAFDIGDALWQDIDTPEAYDFALSQELVESSRSGVLPEIANA